MATMKLGNVVLVVLFAMSMMVAIVASVPCETPSKPLPPKHGSKHHHSHPYKPPTKPSPPIVKPPTSPYPTPYLPPMTPPEEAPPIYLPPVFPSPPPPTTCPVDIIKLGVCVPILGGILGNPSQSDCCALLGLIGLDVEICLCAAIDANVLGIITVHAKLDVIATILTTCGKKLPPNYTCP